MTGTLKSIHIATGAGAEMRSVEEGALVAGRGIAGDRYHDGIGEFSPDPPDPDHELTLVAWEEIEEFNRSASTALQPGELRRNLVTQGIALNALVGREFKIGGARVRGIRLCEPCRYLANLIGPEIRPALVHKAGLRAGIVEGGTVRVGDSVEES